MEHWNDGTVYRLDGKQWRDEMEIDWMEMEMELLMWLLMWLLRAIARNRVVARF